MRGDETETTAWRGAVCPSTQTERTFMQTIVFDLETGPLAESELSALLPPFDPAEVKTGNLKDPAKIAEKIAEAEAESPPRLYRARGADPLTGRVVAIGVMTFDARGETPTAFGKGGKFSIIGHDDEARTLFEFWELTRGVKGRMNPMVGFNIFGFDLPFLFRRSWKHRVPIPFGLRRGRYWSDQLIDLRDAWQLGDRQAKGSLDSIARHLGVGAKNGDGKAFAELWQSNRKQAESYLRNRMESPTACRRSTWRCGITSLKCTRKCDAPSRVGAGYEAMADAVLTPENLFHASAKARGECFSHRRWRHRQKHATPRFIAECPRRVSVTAPTGVAALNVGGMTIHRFCGMLIGPAAGQIERGLFRATATRSAPFHPRRVQPREAVRGPRD